MFQDLLHFQGLYNSKKIHIFNKSLNKNIQKFQFFALKQINLFISKEKQDYEHEKEIQKIMEKINESKIIVIDQLREPYDEYLIIIFDQTIIVISKSDHYFLRELASQHEESTIFTIPDKSISNLPSEIQSKIYKYEEPFKKDYLITVNKFSENLSIKSPNNSRVKKLWDLITPVLSSYFINKSYIKLHEERQLIYDNKKQEIQLKDDNYIGLQTLGQSNTSSVQLIFHCETEQLFALKKFLDLSEEKTFARELNNYKKNFRHPNLPIFYGEAKIEGVDCLIIEYIRGKSLYKINEIELTETDKINIIIQLMLIIEFFQSKKLIYRDLKPDNLIFDDKRNIILIDFDRMIDIHDQYNPENRTKNFSSIYMAPELLHEKLNNYTYEEDVYSIGFLIYYIITQQQPNNDNNLFNNLPSNYKDLIILCKECTEIDPIQRPKITKLIDYFYNYFIHKDLNLEKTIFENNINETKFYPDWKCDDCHFLAQFLNEYDQKTKERYSYEASNIHLFYQFKLISKYYPENYLHVNISKFISCLTNISGEIQSQSQFYLGEIYFFGNYISRDINKSIHYFTLSADQNNSDAQYFLGKIYYLGNYISRDINKSIHYFTLSANQNDSDAQFFLGEIYYKGEYISRDINKSIHYLTLSANQNDSDAQSYLGEIYYKGEYILRDINKSIHYLTLSANQNDSDAQFFLGEIYYKGEYISRDINKSIHYFTLSANQNDSDAQFYLGYIYYKGEYILRDINKSIHYFTLSANQNNSDAQFYLGKIYYFGNYISRDINKSIHYLTLSANQNNSDAQSYLGYIYYEGEYISRDINKSIHYFTLSADQNNSDAQYFLGKIYYLGNYISRDINKSIHYFTLSANQNDSDAQYFLGLLYHIGLFVKRSEIKGIDYLIQSSNNRNKYAHFHVGYVYHEGKHIKQEIHRAITYYKEASNVNDFCAKNNLGIIYKNGFSDEISPNIQLSIEYFQESIRLNEKSISNYNLSHVYIYIFESIELLDKAIELLISGISNNKSFVPSYHLLALALIKKFEFKIENIYRFLKEIQNFNQLHLSINKIINTKELYDEKKYTIFYEFYKNIDFLYNFRKKCIESKTIIKQKPQENKIIDTKYNITKDFYEGFNRFFQ